MPNNLGLDTQTQLRTESITPALSWREGSKWSQDTGHCKPTFQTERFALFGWQLKSKVLLACLYRHQIIFSTRKELTGDAWIVLNNGKRLPHGWRFSKNPWFRSPAQHGPGLVGYTNNDLRVEKRWVQSHPQLYNKLKQVCDISFCQKKKRFYNHHMWLKFLIRSNWH